MQAAREQSESRLFLYGCFKEMCIFINQIQMQLILLNYLIRMKRILWRKYMELMNLMLFKHLELR